VRTSTERIVTTHAGSLVKPRPIREALAAQQAGKPYDEASFRRQLADAVTGVVRDQVDAGVDVPSDGEFGKAHWVWYVTDRLNGVEPAGLGQAPVPRRGRPPGQQAALGLTRGPHRDFAAST
jgi:5-methyltetrahydropteroyltriglutamate--homocysteine methyltransferase